MATAPTKRRPAPVPSAGSNRDPFNSWRDEMNELINRLWSGYENKGDLFAQPPALDLAETENAFEMHLDIPGMKAKDFDVQVHGNRVTLSGKREEKQETGDKKYHCTERRYGSFSRTVTLPCEVNADEVAAEYTNGVLTISLPKAEANQAKRIVVKH